LGRISAEKKPNHDQRNKHGRNGVEEGVSELRRVNRFWSEEEIDAKQRQADEIDRCRCEDGNFY